MNTIKHYVNDFFSTLTIDADTDGNHFYKQYIAKEIDEFLDDEVKREAYDIYSMFLDIYRPSISGEKSFIDLLDVLRKYEESAATLIEKQRDHYNHSINVFLLGLSIYAKNKNYRNTFKTWLKGSDDKINFPTEQEEFFFRWGIASLFHDIGYPVEIINNQFKSFISFISGCDEKGRVLANPYLSYFDFSRINSITELDLNKFLMPTAVIDALEKEKIEKNRITDLLALNVGSSLNIPIEDVRTTLNDFLNTMQKYQFVDHGFYSAIIIVKWFGELMMKNNKPSNLLFEHILDSAAGIYLHNAYRNVFRKKPFSLPSLDAEKHPIGYLLILCDESQEWNREAYGIKSKQAVFIDESNVTISEDVMNLHYVTKEGVLDKDFIENKKQMLDFLLNTKGIFGKGIAVSATTLSEQYIGRIKSSNDELAPRLLIEHIESIAKKIHKNYNKKRLIDFPNEPLQYPTWESLPDTLKYSNIRQARDMSNHLREIGCYIDNNSTREEVLSFTKEEIEYLAEKEHEAWMSERVNNGWVYGEQKNVELKTSPFIVSYDELTDTIKDYDRDVVRNIIPLLSDIGLSVYKSK